MSQLNLKIGPKIKAFRRQLGLQANKLAEDLNISPSYLNLIEGGKRKIDGDLLLKVCEKLRIELSDLTSKADINLENNISELLGDELFDDFDNSCDHFLIFNGKNVVGSLRIIVMEDKIKLERMAILNEYRAKNYGKLCILHIKEYYSALDFSQIILDSIYSVKDFYKKCGFTEEGAIFQRVGIDHIRMFSKF